MKKTARIGFLMILLAFALTACATGGVNTPLPQTINIEQPGSDVPQEIAAFSGRWEGWWAGGMDAVLIVETITQTGAEVIYSCGDAPAWKIKAGYERYVANITSIKGEKPKIEFSNFIVELINPEKIEITHKRYNQMAIMKKVTSVQPKTQTKIRTGPKTDVSHLPEKIRAYHGTWEGAFDNGTPIIEDIEVVSEKKVLVTHSWGNNWTYQHIKAGSWSQETEFNKDGYISITRGNRILTIKLNKDGTLNVVLKSIDSGKYVSGDLKKR